MKLVPSRHNEQLAAEVNGLLNAPTVEELVTEAEALVYEIERRMLKTSKDHHALSAARDKALAVMRKQRKGKR